MGAIEIWTDGACAGNPGPGGWAAIVDGRELSGGVSAMTTSNRMEIQAVIKGLESSGTGPVSVFTDSEYVAKGAALWLPAWKARGWKLKGGKPLKNLDLWKLLDTAMDAHDSVEFVTVKGHVGIPLNERADALATAEVARLLPPSPRPSNPSSRVTLRSYS